jgi:hypothetical protein
MNDEERDLLAAYAHALLEGEELGRAERLVEEDPAARAELAEIRRVLSEAEAWAPEIPRRRLESLPVPRLESRARGLGRNALAGLLKAAALVAIGFGIGFAARSGTVSPPEGGQAPTFAPVRNVGNQGESIPSRPTGGSDTAGSSVASLTVGDELLARGAMAYLAYSVSAKVEEVADSEAAKWIKLLTDPEELWEALPVPPTLGFEASAAEEISG